jgi:tetratricopeptide (TPR) repeat protein
MKKCIFLIGFISQSFAQLQTWQNQLNQAAFDTTKARLYYLMAWELKGSDPVSSFQYVDSAFQIANKEKCTPIIIHSIRLKAILERNTGNFQQSLAYCNQVLQISVQNNDSVSMTISLNELGNTYAKLTDYQNAIRYYNMAIQLSIHIGNGELGMKALGNKALVLDTEGKVEQAIQHYYAALKIGLNVKNDEALANTKVNLGFLYAKLGNFKAAIKFTNEASALYAKLNNQSGLAKAISNLATIDFMKGNLKKALAGYQTSLQIYEKQNHIEGIQGDVNNIAGVLASMGRLAESVDWMKRAMQLGKKYDNKKVIINSYINLGDIYLMMRDFPKAILYSDSGMYLANEHNMLNQLQHAYNNLYRANQAAGHYKEALDNYQQFILIRDSMYSIQVAQKTKEQEIKYQVVEQEKKLQLMEEKDKVRSLQVLQKNYVITALLGGILSLILLIITVIIVLVSRTRNREVVFARKKADLEQQALRSQMNPHFIFNSLNSIQRLYVEGKTNVANEYMADFSTLMRKILDNSSKPKITLKEELNTLLLYLQMEKLRCGDMLEYVINVDEQIDQVNTLVPPMVIQPFVENAIWHGILPKKEKGTVAITIRNSLTGLLCTIEDNGIGFVKGRGSHESKGISLTEKRLNTKVLVEHLTPGTRISFNIS